jgi:hypothetical protein
MCDQVRVCAKWVGGKLSQLSGDGLKLLGADKLVAFGFHAINDLVASLLEKAPEQNDFFDDDTSTNPTHSRLSKDHFSHPMNNLAGLAAQTMIRNVATKILIAVEEPDNQDSAQAAHDAVASVVVHPALFDGSELGVEIRGVIVDWARQHEDRIQLLTKEHVSDALHLSGWHHKESQKSRHCTDILL